LSRRVEVLRASTQNCTRHGGMKEENTDAVIECAQDAFNLAILWRGVGVSELKDGAGGGIEGA